MALGRNGNRRSFRPTLDGTLETRALMAASLASVHVQTASGGQAVVVTDVDGGRYFVSVFNGGAVRATPASGGRVNLVVSGTTSQSLLEINQILPFNPAGRLAHNFSQGNALAATPLNIASLNVTSGRIGSIEGYHDSILSGPLTIGGTGPINRIAFGSIAPGGSISIGGDLDTLDVFNNADFSMSNGLFVARDLNWFEVGGNLTFENGSNAVIGRDLGHTFQPAKGSGNAGQGLYVGGNFTITPPSRFAVVRFLPPPVGGGTGAGILVLGNLTGANQFSIGGLPLSSVGFTTTVQGTVSL